MLSADELQMTTAGVAEIEVASCGLAEDSGSSSCVHLAHLRTDVFCIDSRATSWSNDVWIDSVWQEGSHPKIIETEAMMHQKLSYFHDNPVERGYVCDPTHWRYSSARNYAKMEPLVSVTTDW